MKFIMSWWGKPALEKAETWTALFPDLACWALSHSLARQLGEVHPYADASGRSMLEAIGLEFDSVTPMDIKCNHKLFAYGKMFAISQQQEPFFHIDHDVFLTRPPSKKIQKAQVVVQHLERLDRYRNYNPKMLLRVQRCLPHEFVEYYKKHRGDSRRMFAFNTGILGGTDTDFLSYFARVAMACMDNANGDIHQVVYEQLMLSALCISHNIEVKTMIHDETSKAYSSKVTGRGYTHLQAKSKRTLKNICEVIEQAHEQNPDSIERLLALKYKPLTI